MIRLTHVGGPTLLVEVGGWQLLTDPTFDPPGRRYRFGHGTSSRKVAGPAVTPADVGPVDAVLLTHDHHADNLDDLGRMVLNGASTVLTTESGARRLGGPTVGLAPWELSRLTAPGRPSIDVTATPARHGPPLSRFLVGDVIGFALAWEQQRQGVLWISGDTVLHAGVREVARRLVVDVAVLHLGAVRFPITGPVRYTMSARQAVVACRMLRPRTVVPVHYEGWSHFWQGRPAVERALAAAPDVRERVQWLDPGVPRSVGEPC